MTIRLYPFVKKVPEPICRLSGREKRDALSAYARVCAKQSAIKSNLEFQGFAKNTRGAPLPSCGNYWSVSHKPGIVAGVVSREPVGIDVEELKRVRPSLFGRIVAPSEARLFNEPDDHLIFFRTFTAKEAVLKKNGKGISGLSRTRILEVTDPNQLIVSYLGKKYWVENILTDGYVASVTKDRHDIQWSLK